MSLIEFIYCVLRLLRNLEYTERVVLEILENIFEPSSISLRFVASTLFIGQEYALNLNSFYPISH